MKFPKKFIAAVLILVIGIVGVIICALPKYSDVEAVVADYVAAVDAGDTEAMFECTIAKAASNAMNQFSEEYGDVFGETEETVENTLKNADAFKSSIFSVPDGATEIDEVKLLCCSAGKEETAMGMTGCTVTALIKIVYLDKDGNEVEYVSEEKIPMMKAGEEYKIGKLF